MMEHELEELVGRLPIDYEDNKRWDTLYDVQYLSLYLTASAHSWLEHIWGWSDLENLFVDNFDWAHSKPDNSRKPLGCKRKKGERCVPVQVYNWSTWRRRKSQYNEGCV
jgi:hypothetical protein